MAEFNFTLTGLAQSTDAALNVSYDGTNFTLTKSDKTYIFTESSGTYSLVEKTDENASSDKTSELIGVARAEKGAVIVTLKKDGVLDSSGHTTVTVAAATSDGNTYALDLDTTVTGHLRPTTANRQPPPSQRRARRQLDTSTHVTGHLRPTTANRQPHTFSQTTA